MTIREWRQQPRARVGWVACALVFAIPAAATGVGGVLLGSPSWAARFSFGAIAAAGVIVLRAAWRIIGARVVISTQAVTVAGPLKTRVVPLTEVDRFAARNAGNQPTILLLRRDGLRPVLCWIFNRNGAIWQFNRLLKELQPTADELNQALDSAKAAA